MNANRPGRLTTGEAAQALNLPRRRILTLCDKGVIKAERNRGVRRIWIGEVMQYLAESAR